MGELSHEFWTPESLRQAAGGVWLSRVEPGARLEGVGIDSRTIKPGQVFVAMRGERTDGHRHIGAARAAGATLAIVDRPETVNGGFPAGMGVLHVPDAGSALLKLAAAYRRTLERTKIIAVAGSNGKTTTVRLIQAVLSTRLRGGASARSFNNAIGVPLTILGAKRGDQYLVCEVGTNATGEVAQLAAVVRPDIAVVTSIGREHLEGLGSLAGVAQEEGSLLSFLSGGGLAVITADTDLLDNAAKAAPNAVRFGFGDRADVRVTEVESDEEGVRFCLNGRAWYRVPLLGRHNACNAAAAVAVARRLGLDQADIEQGLAGVSGADMRLALVRVPLAGGEVVVLNDAYNANPESMLAAMETYAGLSGRAMRRVVVLADMLELGEAGAASHAEIGAAAAGLCRLNSDDRLVAVGELSRHVADAARGRWPADQVVHMPTLDAARIASMIEPGDVVLLKGSRGMRLEAVLVAMGERSRMAQQVEPAPGRTRAGTPER